MLCHTLDKHIEGFRLGSNPVASVTVAEEIQLDTQRDGSACDVLAGLGMGLGIAMGLGSGIGIWCRAK